MDTPEVPNPTPSSAPESGGTPISPEQPQTSFLDSVIASAKSESVSAPSTGSTGGDGTGIPEQVPNPPPAAPKKPREPMTPGMILKAIGALLLVAIIFFGSFLAYIVFNPEQAYFFVNVFGINPNDLTTVLKKLINGSFGIVMLVVSIVWIVALFRAIWTPKELKRKRLLSWMAASLIGIILFSILSFWAYLFSILNKIDFTNLGGSIMIYDNELYNNDTTKGNSRLNSTNNLIGPITLKFDISENAKQVQNKNSVQISSYSIDFDGATCNDGGSVVSGTNPLQEKGIICTFDSVKNYALNGTYKAMDQLGKEVNISMSLSPIEMRGVLTRKEQKNKDGKTIITLDASALKNIGTPTWAYKDGGGAFSQDSVTEEPGKSPVIIYLSIFNDIPSKNRVFPSIPADRIFILQSTEKKTIGGTLNVLQDTVNPLTFQFEVTDLNINANLILKIEWSLDDGSLICRQNAENCEYTFTSYGKRKVKATVTLASNESFVLEKDININEPLLLTRHAVVTDSAGKVLNTPETYDTKLRTYLVQNVLPPETLTFDARDIVIENPGYRLSDVVWSLSDGKNIEEKRGEKVTFDISQTLRYTISAEYTFSKNALTGSGELKVGHDSITIDVERKELIPRLFVEASSDYIPARVTVDGSTSKSQHGEIIKFIYNFGDGKPDATGDAIQEYEYTTPGNKEITLTVIDNNGNTAIIKKVVVLKETPKVVDFTASLTQGMIGTPVDFTATNSNGQIEDYIWSFGDNTPVVHGYEVSHTFTKVGIYDVSLTIAYTDGTRKTTSKKFMVVNSLE